MRWGKTMVLKISASSLSSIATCTTKAALQHLGYSNIKESAPLKAGSVSHESIKMWLDGKPAVLALKHFKKHYESWADEHVEEADDRLQHANVAKVLEVYFDK